MNLFCRHDSVLGYCCPLNSTDAVCRPSSNKVCSLYFDTCLASAPNLPFCNTVLEVEYGEIKTLNIKNLTYSTGQACQFDLKSDPEESILIRVNRISNMTVRIVKMTGAGDFETSTFLRQNQTNITMLGDSLIRVMITPLNGTSNGEVEISYSLDGDPEKLSISLALRDFSLILSIAGYALLAYFLAFIPFYYFTCHGRVSLSDLARYEMTQGSFDPHKVITQFAKTNTVTVKTIKKANV